MRPDDIVGYTFRADTFCPTCIIDALPTGDGEPFDGWALAAGATMSTEANLDEIAMAFSIDRGDETTFDSGEFPKVVFRESATDYMHSEGESERCGSCDEPLIEPDD